MSIRALICSAILAISAQCFAGDLSVTASGFPARHRGNGSFTLKEILNADKLPSGSWAENHPSECQWVASYNKHTDTTRVLWSRNGVNVCEYHLKGKSGTASLKYAAPLHVVPLMIDVQ